MTDKKNEIGLVRIGGAEFSQLCRDHFTPILNRLFDEEWEEEWKKRNLPCIYGDGKYDSTR